MPSPELISLAIEVAGAALTLLGIGWGWGAWVVRQTLVTKVELQRHLKTQDTIASEIKDSTTAVRQMLDMHKAEELAYRARVDGDVARLREFQTIQPTHREMAGLLTAIERMRVDITAGIGNISGDVKGMGARLESVHETLSRTQNTVERHEQIISDAAARQGGRGGGRN